VESREDSYKSIPFIIGEIKMTINEAKIEQGKLEDAIATLVARFEAATQADVTSLYVRSVTGAEVSKKRRVTATVELFSPPLETAATA